MQYEDRLTALTGFQPIHQTKITKKNGGERTVVNTKNGSVTILRTFPSDWKICIDSHPS